MKYLILLLLSFDLHAGITPASGVTQAQLDAAIAGANAYTAAQNRIVSTSGDLSFVEDGTITLELSSDRSKTINTLVIQLDSGTCTVSIQKNGVNVTGLASLAVTTSLQSFTATALNSVVAGDKITMIITSTVGASGLAFSLKAL